MRSVDALAAAREAGARAGRERGPVTDLAVIERVAAMVRAISTPKPKAGRRRSAA